MKYRLVIPDKGYVDFDDYQAMLLALLPYRNQLDHLRMDEINDDGSVRATLNNHDLRQIVFQMDAIPNLSLLSKEQKDT